jgi:hypothetical protein
MALHRPTAALITIAKHRMANRMAVAPPASSNLPPAAPAILVSTNNWRCPARNAIRTTPPKHLTLAPPHAKRFTAALIAWNRLIISNLIDETLQLNFM